MALTAIEGTASNIRTDLAVHGSMRRGKGTVGSTTTMNLLIDGRAVFADFGEAMAINEGDRVRAAGSPKSNGLKALAYHNLTNGTHGDGGGSYRVGGVLLLGLGLVAALLVPALPPLIVLPLLILPLAAVFLVIGYRSKAALQLCLQSKAHTPAAPVAP